MVRRRPRGQAEQERRSKWALEAFGLVTANQALQRLLEDVAKLAFGMHRTVIVTLLNNVAATDVVGLGFQAHRRLAAQYPGGVQCVLVATGLQIDAPMVLSARAVLTDMGPEHVRAALVRLAQC